MGAACTQLDVPPETADQIIKQWRLVIPVSDARAETIWKQIGPFIRNPRLRMQLAQKLRESPCKTRFMIVGTRDGQRWTFDVLGGRGGVTHYFLE